MALTACSNPGHTGPAGQDPNAWQTRGCIGKDFTTCYNNLGATAAIDEPHVLPPLSQVKKTDLDGKTVYADQVDVPAYLPEPVQLIMFGIQPDRGTGLVKRVEATVNTDLFHVVSTEDFHKAALFPVLSAILGSECPAMNEAQLAQQFYNQMKPRIVTDYEKHQATRTLWYDQNVQHVPPFHLCGRDITIQEKWGDDIKRVTDNNPRGKYSYTKVGVE